MIAKSIIDTDAFLSMPLSTQALYFHLCMRADDDGFVSNPRKIQRMVSCADDDLKLLMAKRYILAFDSGVIVIKHWKIHNYIRNDRYKETLYLEEKSSLIQKPDGAYTDHILPEKSVGMSVGIPDGNQMDTQVRLGKDRLGKVRLENTGAARPRFTPPTLCEVSDYCKERGNIVDAQRWFDYYTSNGWMVGKNHMKDWKAAIRTWERGSSAKPSGNVFMDIAREEGIIHDK